MCSRSSASATCLLDARMHRPHCSTPIPERPQSLASRSVRASSTAQSVGARPPRKPPTKRRWPVVAKASGETPMVPRALGWRPPRRGRARRQRRPSVRRCACRSSRSSSRPMKRPLCSKCQTWKVEVATSGVAAWACPTPWLHVSNSGRHRSVGVKPKPDGLPTCREMLTTAVLPSSRRGAFTRRSAA